jgi:hypothetical protein
MYNSGQFFAIINLYSKEFVDVHYPINNKANRFDVFTAVISGLCIYFIFLWIENYLLHLLQ